MSLLQCMRVHSQNLFYSLRTTSKARTTTCVASRKTSPPASPSHWLASSSVSRQVNSKASVIGIWKVLGLLRHPFQPVHIAGFLVEMPRRAPTLAS